MNGTATPQTSSLPTATALAPPLTPVPSRPPCPEWCTPATCSMTFDAGWGGWAGLHADPVRMVENGDLFHAVQIQAYQSTTGDGDVPPGISVETNADGLSWLDPDAADALAAALRDAAAKLRAATALRVA